MDTNQIRQNDLKDFLKVLVSGLLQTLVMDPGNNFVLVSLFYFFLFPLFITRKASACCVLRHEAGTRISIA